MSREQEIVRQLKSGDETGRHLGRVALLLGSNGGIEIEPESSPEGFICGRMDRETNLQGRTKSASRGAPFARQGEPNSGGKADKLAVSLFGQECL